MRTNEEKESREENHKKIGCIKGFSKGGDRINAKQIMRIMTVVFNLSWKTYKHGLQLTSSSADKICGQFFPLPLLPLLPFAVQELNYSDNLALFVSVIITCCNYRSAHVNTVNTDT